MAGSRNFYDETDKFFSDDKRSRLFVALNYKGTNFGTSLNTKEYPNTLLNEAIFQLMSKQNHKPEDNQQPNPEKDRMTLAKDFEDFIHKLGKAHAEFDPHLSKGTGRENLDKLKWVYGNWSSMTMEGREFYTTFLNLVSSDGGMAANDPKASPHTTYLNLKKVDLTNRKSDTVFRSTLPYLPHGMKKSDGSDAPTDYLHQLYDKGFQGRLMEGGSKITDDWKTLDTGKFLRNVLYAEHKASAARSVNSPLDNIYDLSTNKLYHLNSDNHIVDNSGTVLNESKLLSDLNNDETCSGTYVRKCNLVYECLLSGDSKALSRCLTNLSIESMYETTRDEVRQMNPQIIHKILTTFAVEVDSRGNIEEYLEWRANFESRLMTKMSSDKAIKTASTVLNNKKLTAYIRNMMDVIRENPDVLRVLTKGSRSTLSDLPEKTRDLKFNSGVKYFIKPTGINRAQALSTQLTSIAQQLNVLPQNFMSSLSMPLQLSNVNFGNPLLTLGLAGVLRGGGCVDETIASLEAIYGEILSELKNSGKDLVDEDKKHIEEALIQLKKNNLQLVSALNDLKAFTRLNAALTAGINKVRLDDIKGASRISLDSQVKNLQSCIDSTSTNQRNLIQTLVSQVFDPMVRLASGVSTIGIRPL
jgi:hypothetical protein